MTHPDREAIQAADNGVTEAKAVDVGALKHDITSWFEDRSETPCSRHDCGMIVEIVDYINRLGLLRTEPAPQPVSQATMIAVDDIISTYVNAKLRGFGEKAERMSRDKWQAEYTKIELNTRAVLAALQQSNPSAPDTITRLWLDNARLQRERDAAIANLNPPAPRADVQEIGRAYARLYDIKHDLAFVEQFMKKKAIANSDKEDVGKEPKAVKFSMDEWYAAANCLQFLYSNNDTIRTLLKSAIARGE